MRLFKLQLVMVTAVLLGGAAVCDAQEPAPFAAVQIHLPNGKTLEAQASLTHAAPHPSSLVLSGSGLLVTVQLPKAVEAGTKVQVPVMLQAGEQVQQAVMTLDVQEIGSFLGGRLVGSFGPLNVSGAFRIRWMNSGGTGLQASSPES